MRRRDVIIGSGTVAAAALAGCLGSAQETPGGEGPTGESTRTIRVSASGEAEAEPDLAILHVGVEATGDDAESVRSELATRSEEVREALLEYGLDEEDVTTSRFYVRERIDRRAMDREGVDPRSGDVEEYRYYDGTHAFQVEVHDVEAAGEVVDVAVDAGADEIGRLEFTLSEDRRDQLREEALVDAIDDARSEGDHVAEQIDATIVEVRTVDTSGGRVHPIREEVALAGADAAPPSTSFQPGDVTVTATVEVEFEMA